MKIKASKNFRDRNTKKQVKAGTVVEADQKRIDILKKHKIDFEVVDEGEVETVKETAEKPKTQTAATKAKANNKGSAKQKETR